MKNGLEFDPVGIILGVHWCTTRLYRSRITRLRRRRFCALSTLARITGLHIKSEEGTFISFIVIVVRQASMQGQMKDFFLHIFFDSKKFLLPCQFWDHHPPFGLAVRPFISFLLVSEKWPHGSRNEKKKERKKNRTFVHFRPH